MCSHLKTPGSGRSLGLSICTPNPREKWSFQTSHMKKTHLSSSFKMCMWGFPGGSVVKTSPTNARDRGLVPALGRSHVPLNGWACVPQLPGLCSRTWELLLLSPHAATQSSNATTKRTGIPQQRSKILCAAAETRHSQINKIKCFFKTTVRISHSNS